MLRSIANWLAARSRRTNNLCTVASSVSPSWSERHEEALRLFWEQSRVELSQRKEFVLTELHKAITDGDEDRVNLLVDLMLQSDDDDKIDVLNEMLLIKGHRRHQEIVREIQIIAKPSSAPYLRRALEDGIDHMIEYNGSGSGVVAKWFSHALFDIGTPDAIETLRVFSTHPDAEIRDEMLYRLSKL